MNCYLCKSEKLRLHIEKGEHFYYKCVKCGLIQQIPLPDDKIIKTIYNGNKIYFIDEKKGINYNENPVIGKSEKFYFSIIKPYLTRDMKILDFGAATGLMLGLLKLNNFCDLEGLELSKWACNEAKKNFNLDLQNVDIYDANYPSEYFDLIISNHVIEHLKDPLQAFIKINQFLKTGGLLFLSTPNGSCLNSRIIKAQWRHFIPEAHLYLFNKKSIKNHSVRKVTELKYVLL